MRHASLLFLCLLICPSIIEAAELFRLKITGNQSPGATLYVLIYDKKAKNWDDAPFSQMKITLPADTNFTHPLELKAGRYAARAFVDLDQDENLARNHKGRPAEPFGSSIGKLRNKTSLRYRLSVFELSHKYPEATLKLRYPKVTQEKVPSAPRPSVPERPHVTHES